MNQNQEVLQIALADIIPNQFQPRVNFDEKELEELAASIKEHGIIQPLVLRKMGQKYEIIAGERRYRAATKLGLATVPAIISNIDDQASAEVALVENVQRKDLTSIEEARSYKNILDKGYLTQEQLAKKMGLSQPAIANKLRLLNLDESVQQALLNNQISERHARSLLPIESKEKQQYWLNRIINERLTVRQLDVEIKKEQQPSSSEPLISIAPTVDQIKNNSSDISFNNPPVNSVRQSSNSFSNNNGTKSQNKFFNFLEEEPIDLNSQMGANESIFNVTPDIPLPEQPVVEPQENKFFTLETPTVSTPEVEETPVIEEPVIKEQPKVEIETLFDPMDQVELLDPEYDKKQLEDAGLDLKSAINQTREKIEELKQKGFNIDVEEIDLNGTYKINITIKEN